MTPIPATSPNLYGIAARRLASLAPSTALSELQRLYRGWLAHWTKYLPDDAERVAFNELDALCQERYGVTVGMEWTKDGVTTERVEVLRAGR